MERFDIALFGEAEKGDFQTAYFCRNLSYLYEYLGIPTKESQGLHFAVQALLYKKNVIFFRVREEGFSVQDYFSGFRLLEKQSISALGIPGVGSPEIISAATPLCLVHKSIILLTEPDLYDYIMGK